MFHQIGQEIKEFNQQNDHFGLNKVSWQTNDLPAGVYFCKVTTNERIQTRKIIKL
ncbi:MAG: T9SS type A sorting domain-containing protein [Bacteroidetes bacterium]|nr:T9SS type A sorting domain-containing protein [Bacteroidota bacterium]